MIESSDQAATRALDHLRNDSWEPAITEVQRERLAAEAAAARQAEAERRARREARVASLTGWLPRFANRK